jgi:hypothetical protein
VRSLVAALCLAIALPVAASAEDGWSLRASPYLWLFFLDGESGAGGFTSDIEADFTDLFDADSIVGLQLNAEARNGRLGLLLDGTWLRADFSFADAPLDADMRLDTVYANALGAWEIANGTASTTPLDDWAIDVMAGGRLTVLALDLDVKGGFTGPADRLRRFERNTDGSHVYFDPLIGLRARADLDETWELRFTGDLGGFGVGSDFTTQLGLFGAARFETLGCEALFIVGYRGLYQDYADDGFRWDVWMHGPTVGLSLQF